MGSLAGRCRELLQNEKSPNWLSGDIYTMIYELDSLPSPVIPIYWSLFFMLGLASDSSIKPTNSTSVVVRHFLQCWVGYHCLALNSIYFPYRSMTRVSVVHLCELPFFVPGTQSNNQQKKKCCYDGNWYPSPPRNVVYEIHFSPSFKLGQIWGYIITVKVKL